MDTYQDTEARYCAGGHIQPRRLEPGERDSPESLFGAVSASDGTDEAAFVHCQRKWRTTAVTKISTTFHFASLKRPYS
jgi:hypothetical protein